MRTIIDSSPLSSPAWISLPHGQRIEFLSRQTIVWLSVTPPTFIALPSQWPRFPAVVDSGFNSTFLMSEQQLSTWAGLETQRLQSPPAARVGIPVVHGRPARLFDALVWIHPNRAETTELAEHVEPFALYAEPGIMISPPSRSLARLPLVGIKLIEDNGLQLTFDPHQTSAEGAFELRMSIRAPFDSDAPPISA
jgi:hypothetical protein